MLEQIVERHRFSLGVVRGLLERHVEAAYASLDGRCAAEDVHGGFVSVNARQHLWVDMQEHVGDQRGAPWRHLAVAESSGSRWS